MFSRSLVASRLYSRISPKSTTLTDAVNKLDQINQRIGETNKLLGGFIGNIAASNEEEVVQALCLHFDHNVSSVSVNQRFFEKSRCIREFDGLITLQNGDLVVIEVKSTLKLEHIQQLENNVDFMRKRAEGCKIYGYIGGPLVDKDVVSTAFERGFGVVSVSGKRYRVLEREEEKIAAKNRCLEHRMDVKSEMDYARALLDELMGPDRNLNERIEKNFYDDTVCKHYLVDYCPNDLFINTKSDLGVCGKIHDDKLKAQYQALSEEERAHYDYEAMFFWRVRGLIRELDWKLRDAKRRLELKGDESLEKHAQALRDERMEKMIMCEEKIKELQARIELCGEEGLVDEARELNNQVEAYNVQLMALKTEESREKRMEACLVCGSLLIVNDSPERVAAHLAGKQHTGFQKLRETYDSLKDKYEHMKEELRTAMGGGNKRDNRRNGGGRGDFRRDDNRDRGERRDYSDNRRDYSDRGERRDHSDRRDYSDRGDRRDYSRNYSDRGGNRGDRYDHDRQRRDYNDRGDRRGDYNRRDNDRRDYGRGGDYRGGDRRDRRPSDNRRRSKSPEIQY